METAEGWRSPKFAEQFEGFERPDFAQEFLRRNAAYVADYNHAIAEPWLRNKLAKKWGLYELFDPARSVRSHKARWRKKFTPTIVSVRGQELDCGSNADEFQRGSFRHILIRDVNGNHQIVWKKSGHDGYRIVIPINCETIVKLRAADRFWRHLEGKNTGPLPSPYRLTNQQQKLLVESLRAMDSQASGLSERLTAQILHDEEIELEDWSDSAERSHLRRLFRRGRYLSDEGYRNLLNPFK